MISETSEQTLKVIKDYSSENTTHINQFIFSKKNSKKTYQKKTFFPSLLFQFNSKSSKKNKKINHKIL